MKILSSSRTLQPEKIHIKGFGSSIHLDTIEQYFLLFILIVVTDTTYWTVIWLDIDRKPLIILIGIMLMFVIHKFAVDPKLCIYAILNIIMYGISAFFNSNNFLANEAVSGVMTTITWVCLVALIYAINKEMTLTRYINIVYFISIISLLFYFLQQFEGIQFFTKMFHTETGRGLVGFFFYFAASRDMERNYGMFGEPGIFQIVLITALFIIIYWEDKLYLKRKRIRNILVVLLITIATTKSALGLVLTGIVFLGTLFDKLNNKVKMRVLLIFMVVIIIAFIDYFSNGANSLLEKFLFTKVAEMELGTSFNENTSGGARVYILSVAFETLKTSPLFGVGSHSYWYYLQQSSRWKEGGTGNALFINIIKHGLIAVSCTIIPIIYEAKKNKRSTIQFVIFTIIFFLIGFMQSQLIYPPLILLAFSADSGGKRYEESSRFKNEHRSKFYI